MVGVPSWWVVLMVVLNLAALGLGVGVLVKEERRVRKVAPKGPRKDEYQEQ